MTAVFHRFSLKASTSADSLPVHPPAKGHSGPELVKQSGVKAPPEHAPQPSNITKPIPGPSGTGQATSTSSSSTGMVDQSYFGTSQPESGELPFAEEHFTESEVSGSLSEPEEDLLSDTTDRTELTEDMNYRETVCSVCSFMGWNHIPPFESDLTEPDKSNNPWKGKNPRDLPEFPWPCLQTIGCVRCWSV